MNKKILPLFLTLPLLAGLPSLAKHETQEVKAGSGEIVYQTNKPSTINLNACSENAIRSYYADLTSKPESERQGTNLLKNLKPILRNNFQYFSYINVWNIYTITDRDWNLSPASELGASYNASTNTITNYKYDEGSDNPYVHAYYRDRINEPEDSKVKAFGDHTSTGINREHIWPKSHGFKSSESDVKGPAGTDLHHLVAADGYVNQSIHNNDPYGYVGTEANKGNRASTKGNKVGLKKNATEGDVGDRVFEPIDQDKGDIARACFYMVAMYNNFAHETGVISQYDPNLNLVSYVTKGDASEASSDTEVVVYGNLKDLLEWNKLDPVDEYEIYRNDLIYNNFEHNRNPFIDFPEWADIAWGDLKETRAADPAHDELYKGGAFTPPEEEKIPTWVFIVGGVVVIVVIIVVAVVLTKGNKKQKKALKKAIKKTTKKLTK